MSPLREFRSLTTRFEEDVKIDLLRRYYLIFEGANTERKYFQGVANNRKELDINSQIELVILHKEGDIGSFSHPIKLLELIEEKKKYLKRNGKFDRTIDRFVIVFDRDSYEATKDYVEFIDKASVDNILIVTSPCFELWLILHYQNAIEKHIIPNKKRLFDNEKVSSSHTFASRLFSEISGTNPKSGTFFNKLKSRIDLAIEQEKSLERDIFKMDTEIGSNVGVLIEQMREDPRDMLNKD
ncbi:RloB family protein [Fusibacter ferrireducens]|uniref:RloB domain-containing protein n=1 Tax=Fusibacter ferrireducens TaxID=2785058 RepID=A0ABR9ZUA5_9FIRM|nr:RloB family protein [Fusibacter ferrireducens]MBF4693465.1 RloB domain-containing protein [Fusibacter ferrireducens]